MEPRFWATMADFNLFMTKTRTKMFILVTTLYQQRVQTPWSVMNLSTTHNSTMHQSSEETNNLLNLMDLKQKNLKVLTDQWPYQLLDKLLLRTSYQLDIGNHHIKVLLKNLPKKKELSQEDLSGQLIDKLIHHQEDHIRVSSLMLLESMVTNQETSYQWLQWPNHTRVTNYQLVPPKLLLIFQATTALFQPLILIF